MAPNERDHAAEDALDVDYHAGAVEDGARGRSAPQILPVWASSEPFGYSGSTSDRAWVGGGGAGGPAAEPGEARAEREIIGPEAG